MGVSSIVWVVFYTTGGVVEPGLPEFMADPAPSLHQWYKRPPYTTGVIENIGSEIIGAIHVTHYF